MCVKYISVYELIYKYKYTIYKTDAESDQIVISNTTLPTALRLFRNSKPSSTDWLLKGNTLARIGLIRPSSARLGTILS